MKRLPLHELHEARHATLGEFAGHSMPLYYTKPLEEHHAVRQGAGAFDISHMGQFLLSGRRAEDALAYLLPNTMRGMADGDARYSPMLREDGGVLDDLFAYRLDANRFRLVVNGATREKDNEWIDCIAQDFGCTLEDFSESRCLLALQGPQALGKLGPHAGHDPAALGYHTFVDTVLFGVPVWVARTGYTGEPGCELSVAREHAAQLWERLTDELGFVPIGLAARDSLRLEAALPLYGHELREEWHPLESGLAWAVKLDGDEEFVGRKALLAIRGVGYAHRLVGLELTGRGIARDGYRVLQNGEAVGMVTSGGPSPTTGKSVALARVEQAAAVLDMPLQIEVRNQLVDAKVVKRPFYRSPALKS